MTSEPDKTVALRRS